MYNDRIYLTAQEILEKEFKIDARGYRPQEVDKFLDTIIRDYNEFSSIIKMLETEIKKMTDDNNKLKHEVLVLKEQLEISKSSENKVTSVNNIDLLKRISQLEKVVFGKEN